MRSRREGRPGPPDFIGVGTEGTGTDWWLAALAAHRAIDGPRRGELALHFFDRFCERELTEADIAAYHGRFPARDGTIRGEWTGRYMSDGWVPPLLRRVAPDARLLVMVADPIERYRAAFVERRAALRDYPRLLTTDVVDRACHAFQLARLERYFEPERILVLQFERCRADPVGEYRRTLRFLGVRDDAVPRQLTHRGGLPALLRRLRGIPAAPATPASAPLWPELEGALHASLDREVMELRARVPELDLRLWPNFAHLAAT
jgi:Sulfotransferase family